MLKSGKTGSTAFKVTLSQSTNDTTATEDNSTSQILSPFFFNGTLKFKNRTKKIEDIVTNLQAQISSVDMDGLATIKFSKPLLTEMLNATMIEKIKALDFVLVSEQVNYNL